MPLPSVSQLRQALKIAEKLKAMETELAGLMGGTTNAPKAVKRGRPPGKPKKSGMSKEGRQRIAEAQKKRWAAQKSTK